MGKVSVERNTTTITNSGQTIGKKQQKTFHNGTTNLQLMLTMDKPPTTRKAYLVQLPDTKKTQITASSFLSIITSQFIHF